MSPAKAEEITIAIMKVILQYQNGYSLDEIDNRGLAQDCIGSDLFEGIQQVLLDKYAR